MRCGGFMKRRAGVIIVTVLFSFCRVRCEQAVDEISATERILRWRGTKRGGGTGNRGAGGSQSSGGGQRRQRLKKRKRGPRGERKSRCKGYLTMQHYGSDVAMRHHGERVQGRLCLDEQKRCLTSETAPDYCRLLGNFEIRMGTTVFTTRDGTNIYMRRSTCREACQRFVTDYCSTCGTQNGT